MKKIIVRVLLVLLAIVVVIVAAAAILIFMPRSKGKIVNPTVTDASGNIYYEYTDEKGQKYAVVTDKNGEAAAAEIDENGKVGDPVFSLSDKYTIEDLPGNYSGPAIDETVTGSFDGTVITVENTTAAPTTAPTTAPTSQSPDQTTQTTAPTTEAPAPLKIEKYKDLFSAGTYYMEFTTNDETLGSEPIVAAAKGGNIIVSANIEGMRCKILYRKDKDTTYLLIDNFKKYMKLPEDLMGEEFSMTDMSMMENFAKGMDTSNATVTEVTLNGNPLTCESAATPDGGEMKYYFSGDTLVRMDSIEADGTTTSTFITKLTSDVDDSTFEIPKGYGYINISWLSFLSGDSLKGDTTTAN